MAVLLSVYRRFFLLLIFGRRRLSPSNCRSVVGAELLLFDTQEDLKNQTGWGVPSTASTTTNKTGLGAGRGAAAPHSEPKHKTQKTRPTRLLFACVCKRVRAPFVSFFYTCENTRRPASRVQAACGSDHQREEERRKRQARALSPATINNAPLPPKTQSALIPPNQLELVVLHHAHLLAPGDVLLHRPQQRRPDLALRARQRHVRQPEHGPRQPAHGQRRV